MQRTVLLLVCLVSLASWPAFAADAAGPQRPNILWVISEDNGPHLGCYGDEYATTPHLDRFAADALRYRTCWSNAPVCAPARTALILGMYPTSTGGEHMRSLVPLPDGVRMFPQYLREAGYLTANWRKEDFNHPKPGRVWDVENDERPWRKRGEGQPFFAVFNIQVSHESQIRSRPHTLVHDPDKAPVPAYHPDVPAVRRDWAQYYDKLTAMDRQAGAILDRLKEDGLWEETVVFYFGDHGSGMPRSKRCPQSSGLRVPLIVRIPETYRHLRPADYEPGAESRRLTAFVDFGPTVLSLAGISPPEYQQGAAFLGEHAGPPHEFLHGFRGRMDERIDLVRSVTDGRYVYVRHYMPHRIYGQHVGYMFQTPTTRVWKELYDAGRLEPPQTHFWEEKPAEELFDLENDPDEVRNLVDSPEHRGVLERLRQAQRDQVLRVRDVGLLPEADMHARIRESGLSPYELARDASLDPQRIWETAELATNRHESALPELIERLDHSDAAIRFWALTGLLVRKEPAFDRTSGAVQARLDDPSPSVRIVAAELVGRYGTEDQAERAADVLLEAADHGTTDEYAAAAALLVLDELLTARPKLVTSRAAAIRDLPLPAQGRGVNPRAREYPGRLKETITARLAEQRE